MTSAAWHDIDSLRANPPGKASAKDRRAVFTAALQQAGELAHATEVVGYASKPLPLFYMLSQAGRAIVAAHHQHRSDYVGHGLSFTPGNRGMLAGGVEPVETKPPLEAAFQAVATATGSNPMTGKAQLGALWAANPDLADIPIPDNHGSDQWWPALSSDIGGRSLAQNPAAQHGTGGKTVARLALPGRTGADLESVISHYPTLAGTRALKPGPPPSGDTYADPGDEVGRDEETGRVTVAKDAPLFQPLAEAWAAQDRLFSVVEVDEAESTWQVRYCTGWALPSVANGPAPSPLMLWWALLYGLSGLARYSSGIWTKEIDLDRSLLASPLRAVLDRAPAVVPGRVFEALRG